MAAYHKCPRETGRYDPGLPLAFRIAEVFGLSIEAIFTP